MPLDESFDGSAEDRRPNTPSPAPRDLDPATGQADCHRRRDGSAEDRRPNTPSPPRLSSSPRLCEKPAPAPDAGRALEGEAPPPTPSPEEEGAFEVPASSLPDGEGLREGSLPPEGVGHPHPASPSRGRSTRKIACQATSAVAYTGPAPEADDPLLAFAPYLHPHPRSNSITPERQRQFVATLAATGIVTQAARSIGKSMEALYRLRAKPGAEGFAAAWDAALERGVQRLEDCALERALQGTPTPIVSGGKLLGTWNKPDNALLRFLLQHRLPARYANDSHVAPGHPLYERIRKEVLEQRARETEQSQAEIFASLDRKLALIRRRRGADGVWRSTYDGPGEADRDDEASDPPDSAMTDGRIGDAGMQAANAGETDPRG